MAPFETAPETRRRDIFHRPGTPRILAVMTFLLFLASLCSAARRDTRRAAFREARAEGVTVEGPVAGVLENRLRWAHRAALRKVTWVSSCRRLFAELDADGLEVLRRTTYGLVGDHGQAHRCRDAVAFTTVGSSRVWLCERFLELSDDHAAVVLLHEALHSAGLGEQPVDPDAPTSRRIDEMVEMSCGFQSRRASR